MLFNTSWDLYSIEYHTDTDKHTGWQIFNKVGAVQSWGTPCVFRTLTLHLCFTLALAGLSKNSSYIIAGKNVPGNSSCMAIVFL